MDLQKIKQLIDVLAASDLAELELVEGDHRVRLVKRVGAGAGAGMASAPRPPDVRVSAPAVPAPAPAVAAAPVAPQEAGERVTAPLYGVLHLTPSPDAPAFVRLGDAVQAGQTLCVVEAMKMFHEVKATRPGTVTALYAAAGDEVEAGAALFQLAALE
jgi:acetyl-CoA carboxylase biotin carboxyl carrier protein